MSSGSEMRNFEYYKKDKVFTAFLFYEVGSLMINADPDPANSADPDLR